MNETHPFLREFANACSVEQILAECLKTDEMPQETLEKSVFHYTSLDVMNEMCKENGDFLATHVMSLNDTHEFFLGVHLALREVELCKTLPDEIRKDLPRFQIDARERIVNLLNSAQLRHGLFRFRKSRIPFHNGFPIQIETKVASPSVLMSMQSKRQSSRRKPPHSFQEEICLFT